MTLTAKNILIIDSAIEDRQTLLDGVILGTEIVILDAHLDGIIQITQALKDHTEIDSLHIVSHGSPGCLYLGKTQLNLDTLENYSSQLQQWRPSFTETATILLYGCNVAAGDGGEEFIQKLHQITRAEIGASAQPTGNAALGGDWELEVKTGEGKAPLAFDAKARQAYAGVLAIFKVNSTADDDNDPNNGYTLREAIVAANSLPDEDTIDFGELLGTKTIILTSLLPTLTTDIIFNGTVANPLTISGADNYQIFKVTNNATVSFNNFILADGRARGTNGGNGNFGGGGGGAAGMGGALFIDSGRVTASGVTFNNNQALGGDGGFGAGLAGDDGSDELAGKGGGEGGGNAGQFGGFGGSGGFGSGGGGGGYGFDGFDGGGGFGGLGGGGGGGGYGVGLGDGGGGSEGFGGFGGGFGGGGGGGGAGLGGAVFVKAGTLDLINTTFTNNKATGGLGGLGKSPGVNGQGKGGAIFVYTGAKVNFQTLPTFEGNTAANANTDPNTSDFPADNEDVYGTILLTIKPNTPPVVATALTDTSATVDKAFSYSFLNTTFTDDEK
ncbi:DUF4347 domain-containing protein, partial [Microcoleus sp. B13-B4]